MESGLVDLDLVLELINHGDAIGKQAKLRTFRMLLHIKSLESVKHKSVGIIKARRIIAHYIFEKASKLMGHDAGDCTVSRPLTR